MSILSHSIMCILHSMMCWLCTCTSFFLFLYIGEFKSEGGMHFIFLNIENRLYVVILIVGAFMGAEGKTCRNICDIIFVLNLLL